MKKLQISRENGEKNGGQLDDSEMLRKMMMPAIMFYAIQQVELR